MDFESSKLLKLTKILTKPRLTLTFSNVAPPEWAPLEFSKTILKLEIERIFKRFSKVNLKFKVLKWHRVPTGLELLWMWRQLSGPTSVFENFEINTENNFEKGLKSIIKIQSFEIESQANWNSGLES